MNRDFSRQSFLGAASAEILGSIEVGIVGSCGGGSHIAQQLAHVGVKNFTIADPQRIDRSNLNRLVGATEEDVKKEAYKVHIAERTIKNVDSTARVTAIPDEWQTAQLAFRRCQVILGCVDSFDQREQLERFCRRFLIHYIDIGMDVFSVDDRYRIVGQVALSSPECACLRCMAIITEKNLKEEAQKYGAAGPNPQVVWPNGVLASTAVGLFMQLATPWHPASTTTAYLEYNGNGPTLTASPRLAYLINVPCSHYLKPDLGDPFFDLERIVTI